MSFDMLDSREDHAIDLQETVTLDVHSINEFDSLHSRAAHAARHLGFNAERMLCRLANEHAMKYKRYASNIGESIVVPERFEIKTQHTLGTASGFAE